MSDKVIPVKVALRIRPLNQREKSDACTECLRTINGEPQVILGKDKPFTYDFVFAQQTPQIDVYETAVKPLLDALFKGYNATVLAYGQTGSGKTHTMGSGYAALQSATATLDEDAQNTNGIMNLNDLDDVGVIPRVLNDLFTKIDDEQRVNKENKFTVKVSFVEVYNEEIKDLFNLKANVNGQNEPLNIREENNTIRVVNLSEIVVTNSISTIQLLEKGSSMRVVGGTAMNDQSSRSHAIFTITLEQTRTGTVQNGPSADSNNLIKSKFHLVDLAGSERQSKTKAEGIRLKEGININLGLLALGNVISVLGEDCQGNKAKHVPYRESKLTRLLQDSLGGNSHTVMIACVSPADSNMEETLNTLRYADRARKIKNKPIVNIDPQAAELNSLRQQVQELKAHIYQLNGGTTYSPNAENNSTEIAQLKEENEKIKTENTKYLIELQRLIIVNRQNYDKMYQLETERDELKKKFEEIKQTFEKMTKEGEDLLLGPAASLDQTINHNKTLINELQTKLGEFEKIKESENEEQAEMTESELNLDQNEPMEKDFALRQAKMQCQLSEYDTELAKKEILFRKMIENNINSIKDARFEANMAELKLKIESLEKEKEDLLDVIRNGDTASKKQADAKKDRLKQLEGEVMDLKKKEKEFQKMIKLKEENEKHCEKLRQEIQNIKQERVKLIKQMRADTDSFRKYRQEKEKEVNQLKAMERKRLVEISKLQEGNNRQEAVLRRKNEELTRIQKQLRETLEKQKQVAEKRQLAFEKKDSSTSGDRLRTWITQELELSVSIAEARINLSKLLEERKENAADLARLTDKLNRLNEAENSMSRNKRKYTENDTEEGEDNNESSKTELMQRIQRLNEEIECKSLQINEIQQMVIDGEQEDRPRHMFNTLHGLMEAKVLLKHLYNSGVQYLLDSKLKTIQYETTSTSLNHELKELKKKYESMEEEYEISKKKFNKEISDLCQHYEQRVFYIINNTMLKCKNEPNEYQRLNIDLLFDQLKALEKKFENASGQFAEPFPKKELGDVTNKEEHKRGKIKREHRRTRIIRTIPELNTTSENQYEPNKNLNDVTVNIRHIDSVLESPVVNSPDVDNRFKDPDWSKTPLVRTKKRQTSFSKKLNNPRRSRQRPQTIVLASHSLAENSENFSNNE